MATAPVSTEVAAGTTSANSRSPDAFGSRWLGNLRQGAGGARLHGDKRSARHFSQGVLRAAHAGCRQLSVLLGDPARIQVRLAGSNRGLQYFLAPLAEAGGGGGLRSARLSVVEALVLGRHHVTPTIHPRRVRSSRGTFLHRSHSYIASGHTGDHANPEGRTDCGSANDEPGDDPS